MGTSFKSLYIKAKSIGTNIEEKANVKLKYFINF